MNQAICHKNDKAVLDRVRAIIERGNIARFTNTISGCVKDVNEFNLDEDGDLTAFRTEGQGASKYVCPTAVQYEITEVKS